MRQFIVHAICYHDSTPARMLRSIRQADKFKCSYTTDRQLPCTCHPQRRTVSFRSGFNLAIMLCSVSLKRTAHIMRRVRSRLVHHTQADHRFPSRGLWNIDISSVVYHFSFPVPVSSSLLVKCQVRAGRLRCQWILTTDCVECGTAERGGSDGYF